MLNFKNIILSGLVIAVGGLMGSEPVQATTWKESNDALEAQLAESGFKQGPVVEFVPGFTLKGWEFVSPWYMTVKGSESSTFLVTLQNKCFGLDLKRSSLIVKNSKSKRLARNDTFLIKNQGMTVAHCKVKEVNQLDPLN